MATKIIEVEDVGNGWILRFTINGEVVKVAVTQDSSEIGQLIEM